ncbi:hypothetical protein ABZ726_24910 [Streptomyces hundungensis]|uniref:hypothetical protein n=1 Tax=Streptomyces hundungensis TaxID=1077946 RepID=UPI0033C48C93
MTVAISTGKHRTEVPVFSAAATAYTQREVDLSHALLAFAHGFALTRPQESHWPGFLPLVGQDGG